MPSAGGPLPDLAQYVNAVFASLISTLLSKADAAIVYATNASVNALKSKLQNPFISMITFNTLSGPQTNANLLVGLSGNSRPTIPAGASSIGDVYRLQFNAAINALVIGNSCTLDLATASAGTIATFPIIASTTPLIDVPALGRVDITIESPTTIHTNITIGGFLDTGSGSVLHGYSFAASGVPFDSSIDQTFTFKYNTADVASVQMTEILMYRVASGSL